MQDLKRCVMLLCSRAVLDVIKNVIEHNKNAGIRCARLPIIPSDCCRLVVIGQPQAWLCMVGAQRCALAWDYRAAIALESVGGGGGGLHSCLRIRTASDLKETRLR